MAFRMSMRRLCTPIGNVGGVAATSPPPPASSKTTGSAADGDIVPSAKMTQKQFVKELTTPEPKQYTTIPPGVLYRRFIKFFIRRFDNDYETIIKSWKQCKYEFWTASAAQNPNMTAEDALALNIRGQQILDGLISTIIPIYTNDATGQTYAKYDSETLRAAHHQVDPIDAEEYLRRYHDRIPEEEREEIKQRLKDSGRWKGPDEFSSEDLNKLKVRRKRLTKTTCGPEGGDADKKEQQVGTGEATSEAYTEPVSIGKK